MPGYKVVLRILIIVLIVGGTGTLIYFLVGGFSNTKTAHNVYVNIKSNSNYEYIQENLNESSEAYGVINNGTEEYPNFEKWYSCYKAQAIVFDEFGQTLYFSSQKVNREMSGKVGTYISNMQGTKDAIAVLLERKKFFDEHGQGIEDGGASELKRLANVVKEKFYSQVRTLCSLNEMVISFALGSATSDDASLKDTMLQIMFAQSKLLMNCLDENNETNIALTFSDNKQAVVSFNAQKADNFKNQSVQGTDEFNMMLVYESLSSNAKESFLTSVNKKSFVDRQSPIVKTNFGYIMKVMGWEA